MLKKLKGISIILLSLSVAFLIIGIHQVMMNGFIKSYWIFMIVAIFFLGYYLTKKNNTDS